MATVWIDPAGPARPRVALVTGASRGLGLELTRRLAADGWRVVVAARDAAQLAAAVAGLGARVRAVAGDVTDPEHRQRLGEEARALGDLELLVNNASTLGPTPLPALVRYPLDGFRRVLETNVVAPLALAQSCLPALEASHGVVVNVSAAAAVARSRGWPGDG